MGSEVSGENFQYLAFQFGISNLNFQTGSIQYLTRTDFNYEMFLSFWSIHKIQLWFSKLYGFYSVDQKVFFKKLFAIMSNWTNTSNMYIHPVYKPPPNIQILKKIKDKLGYKMTFLAFRNLRKNQNSFQNSSNSSVALSSFQVKIKDSITRKSWIFNTKYNPLLNRQSIRKSNLNQLRMSRILFLLQIICSRKFFLQLK